MEILMLVKTKNAGQFNAIFENKEDFKELKRYVDKPP